MTEIDLPPDWSSRRLKYLATYNDEVLAESTDEEKEIDYIQISGVSFSHGVEKVERMTFGQAPVAARRKVRSGDILISTVRTYLRAIVRVDEASPDLIASTGFCVVRPSDDVDGGFLGWVVKSEPFIAEVVSRSVGVIYPITNAIELVNINIPVPSLDTQRRIARFLDDKTARINGLIEKKHILLDRLVEKRQALITHAVTKGLDGLTQEVSLSQRKWEVGNIEFIYDDLPRDWTCRRLRFDVCVNPKKSSLNLEPHKPISFISMNCIGEYGDLSLDDVRDLKDVYNEYTYFSEGDLCIAKITPCFENGKGFLAERLTNGVGFGTTELHVVRPRLNIDRRFLFYVSISDHFRKLGESEMYGTAGQKRLDESFIKNWMLLLPPLNTQRRIARFLHEETVQIDRLTELIVQSLKKLIEYRSALITDAVVGQLSEYDDL